MEMMVTLNEIKLASIRKTALGQSAPVTHQGKCSGVVMPH